MIDMEGIQRDQTAKNQLEGSVRTNDTKNVLKKQLQINASDISHVEVSATQNSKNTHALNDSVPLFSRSAAVDSFNSKTLKHKHSWQVMLSFVSKLNKTATKKGLNIIDIVSGSEEKSVLKRLYDADDKAALMLLESRLKCLHEQFSDPERLSPFDGDETEAMQQIHCMQLRINLLCKEKNIQKFNELLEWLEEFEEEESLVPYEARCDIALLKRARVDISKYQSAHAIPDKMIDSIYYMLDPTNISKTKRGYIMREDMREVKYMLHNLCISEGKKQQKKILKRQVDKFYNQGDLDLERYTIAENITKLCKTKTMNVWTQVNAFYEENRRVDKTRKNPLSAFKNGDDRQAFLSDLISKDKDLSAWVKNELTHLLLALEEEQITKVIKCGNNQNKLLFNRLSSFHRQAKATGYVVDIQITKLFETLQVQEVLSIICNGGVTRDALWLMDNTEMTEEDIKKHLTTNKPTALSKCVQALRTCILASAGMKTGDEYTQMLKAKDALLKSQIEWLFAKARTNIDDQALLANTPETIFNSYLSRIVALEEMRPAINLMDEKITFTNVVGAIGCCLIRGGESPVSQRLRDISLEYQLKHHFDYNFTTEITTQISTVPGQFCSTVCTVAGKIKEAVSLVYNTVTGSVKLSDACKQSLFLQAGASNAVLDTVRNLLENYATMCKHNPHMARVLAGNIAQTLAVIENTVGTGSEIYCIFNEFKARVGMEAMASYVAEQFDPADMDISALNKKDVESLKKIFALCQLFKWAPEAVVGVTGAADIARNTVNGSATGTAWAAVKSAFKMATTHMIKQGVSSLSDESVQGLNVAIMAWQYGPKEAALRLQAMQTAAEFMADQAKKHSATYSAVKAFFRPVITRFTRISKAYNNWKQGKVSAGRVIAETIKLALVVSPVVGSAVAAPLIGILISPALIFYVASVGPAVSFAMISLFYHTDPYEDISALIGSKVSKLLTPSTSSIVARANKETIARFKAGGYAPIKRRMAYSHLYTRYWMDFVENNKALAESFEHRFEQSNKSGTAYHEKLNNLKNMLAEFKALEIQLSGDTGRNDILKCVSDSLHADIPSDKARATYWAVSRMQFIREMLFQQLGTDLVPHDGSALEAKLYNYEKKLAMVECMCEARPDIKTTIPATMQSVEQSAISMVASIQEQAYLQASSVVMRHTITNMAGDNKLTKDRLDKLVNSAADFNKRIGCEFEAMKQVFEKQAKV